MKSNFLPLLLVYALAMEPILNSGQGGTQNVKSYKAKVRIIDRSIIGLSDQVLGRPLRGRQRYGLIATLEEDAYIPPVGSAAYQNSTYNAVKELVASLEDDYKAVQGGDLSRRKSFRRNHKQFREKFALLNASTGAYRQSPRKRTYRKVSKADLGGGA